MKCCIFFCAFLYTRFHCYLQNCPLAPYNNTCVGLAPNPPAFSPPCRWKGFSPPTLAKSPQCALGRKQGVTFYLCRYQTRHQNHPPHCKTDTSAPGHTSRHPCLRPCGSRSLPAPPRTPGSSRSRQALSSYSAGCFCTRYCHNAQGNPPHTWCSRPSPGAQGQGGWPATGASSSCLPAGWSSASLSVVSAGGKQPSKVVAEPLPTRLWVLYAGLPACFPVINFLNPAAALSSCQALLF